MFLDEKQTGNGPAPGSVSARKQIQLGGIPRPSPPGWAPAFLLPRPTGPSRALPHPLLYYHTALRSASHKNRVTLPSRGYQWHCGPDLSS